MTYERLMRERLVMLERVHGPLRVTPTALGRWDLHTSSGEHLGTLGPWAAGYRPGIVVEVRKPVVS